MALRSMSPRITGALIGFAVLSACGSNPPALTSPSPQSSTFSTKQFTGGLCAPGNLLPFSYFGSGYGASVFGLGVNPFLSPILGGPFGLVPGALVPFKDGAIGSALPFVDASDVNRASAAAAWGSLGWGPFW